MGKQKRTELLESKRACGIHTFLTMLAYVLFSFTARGGDVFAYLISSFLGPIGTLAPYTFDVFALYLRKMRRPSTLSVYNMQTLRFLHGLSINFSCGQSVVTVLEVFNVRILFCVPFKIKLSSQKRHLNLIVLLYESYHYLDHSLAKDLYRIGILAKMG